ncbi:MAG: hypothetical protein ACLP1Q_09185 [Solirubrobacteraceae bacterium]
MLLGTTAVESQYDSLPSGQAEAFRLQASANGLAALAHVYISGASTASTLTVGLYSSAGSHPATLLSSGSALAFPAKTWIAVSIAPVELVAGRTYWLAILGDGGRLRYRDRRSGPCPSQTSAQTTLDALPSSWRTATTYLDCPLSGYVTNAPAVVAEEALYEQPALSNEVGLDEAAPAPAPTPPTPEAPVNTSPPTIAGNPTEGQVLSASSGTWSENPTSFTYQWQDCNAAGEHCLKASGATSSTYTLAAGDVGRTARVVVTASNAGGSSQASSAVTATVASGQPPPPPTNTVLPAVSGTAIEGETLSASTGTWSESPTSYAHQWQDCNAAGEDCLDVAGATGSSYTLAASDVGSTVRVVVTASNAGGSTEASSAATATVAAAPPPPPAPTNTALPAVSGSVVEGQTLSASTGTWTESPTSYAYQWQDCNTAGEACTIINGATNATYKLTAGDVEHTLRVVVTASNAGGSTKATSAATGTVPPQAPTNTALPTVSGTAEEGQTLSASNGSWTGSPSSYAYQWQDCNTAGEACTNINGATSAAYKLAAGDVGHTLRVAVSASNAGGSTKATSAATATVLPQPPTNTALPTVSGTTTEGQTLSASNGSWTGSPTSYAYQWQDCNTSGEACANINAATSATYRLAAGDVGHTLRVIVTASNAGGSTKATSAATATVLPPAPTNTTLPTISGTDEEGQTLSASTGSWTGSPTSFAYQWQDCNTAGEACTNINGATNATYKLAAGDAGHTLRAIVTASNAGGSTKASSAATATVVPPAPTNTALPTVSGTTTEGQTLSASTGSWTGSPTSYAYQWQDCNTAGEACTNISAATSATYKLAAGDVGHTLRVVVTASNAGGSTKATSAATATAVPPAPTNTALPTISGSAVEGQTLSASNGSWTNSPTSFAYQWQDCNTAGEACTNISAATSATYKLAAGDVGHTLRVIVTASNAGGFTKATSAATATVVPPAPTNTALPTISGSAVEGQTLSVSTGTWTGSPTSYAYQWQDCNTSGEACTNISGATSATYALAASDVGHTLRGVVTASNAGGSTKATSAATGTVLPPAPTNTALPTVSGTGEEGQTLSASTGSWTNSPTSYAYQWQDCNTSGEACTNISGATSATYKLATGDIGHTLRVIVTASNAGGSTKATSAATGTVVPPAPTNTAAPTISGTTTEGQTLSATTGTWTESPTSYAYQWQDCSSSGEACTNIGGATSATRKLTASDVGHTMRVVVTASNAGGSGKATSAATATVEPPAPTNTALPTVSGTAEEGQTLSASTGSWTGSPTSYAYQWQDCNTAGETCTNISGATATTYKLAAGDVGHTLRVVVTASNAGGTTTASSAATAVVSAEPSHAPTNTELPLISGSAVEGETLTASNGSWTGSPSSFTYQWEDCNGAGESCSSIGSATASSYKLAASDVGHTVRVVVTAHNGSGSGSATAAATGSVTTTAYRTFYISYEAGSESNSGTSESAPWKLAPGMRGFTHSYSHKAGDHFIFEGGVTWPNSALPLIATGSGEAGNEDYYGVSDAWHKGGSYSAPSFNAEEKATSGLLDGYKVDEMMNMSGLEYITVEGIHFTGFSAKKDELAGLESEHYYCYGLDINNGGGSGDKNIHFNKINFTDWAIDFYSHESSSACTALGTRPEEGSLSDQGLNNDSLTNSVMEAKEGEGASWSVYCLSRIENNVIGKSTGLVTPCGNTTTHAAVVANNTLFDCGYPYWPAEATVPQHGDALQSSYYIPAGGQTEYIYNNVIYGTGAIRGEHTTPIWEGKGGEGGSCESALLGGEAGDTHSDTTYMWNNVFYDIYGNSPHPDTDTKSYYFWNNTLEAGNGGENTCLVHGHPATLVELVYRNNLCITTASGSELTEGVPTSGSEPIVAETTHINDNLVVPPSAVASDGYTTTAAPYVFSPASESAKGVGKGENRHTICAGMMTSSCEDTTYGGGRDALARPASGSWDIGAYQW